MWGYYSLGCWNVQKNAEQRTENYTSPFDWNLVRSKYKFFKFDFLNCWSVKASINYFSRWPYRHLGYWITNWSQWWWRRIYYCFWSIQNVEETRVETKKNIEVYRLEWIVIRQPSRWICTISRETYEWTWQTRCCFLKRRRKF